MGDDFGIGDDLNICSRAARPRLPCTEGLFFCVILSVLSRPVETSDCRPRPRGFQRTWTRASKESGPLQLVCIARSLHALRTRELISARWLRVWSLPASPTGNSPFGCGNPDPQARKESSSDLHGEQDHVSGVLQAKGPAQSSCFQPLTSFIHWAPGKWAARHGMPSGGAALHSHSPVFGKCI